MVSLVKKIAQSLICLFANFFYLCLFNFHTMNPRAITWSTPYTFSGKEKDVETGYGYFGARYYDSGLSIWLSVDPMSDNYPSMSPYNYCANNPVILVDPDGRDIYTFDESGNLVDQCKDETGFDQVNVIKNDGTLIEGDKYEYGTITNIIVMDSLVKRIKF